MDKYRRKPLIFEAIQFSGENSEVISEWSKGVAFIRGTALPVAEREMEIETFEGTIRAEFGDWIIKRAKGEFYPCKPNIFKETYEKVADES